MLTGDQIAEARKLAGFATQAELARAAGVSDPTVARAEASKDKLPTMSVTSLSKIVKCLEQAGIVFEARSSASLSDGATASLRSKR